MKPGDIIRRTTKSGFPIGAYFTVTKVNKQGIYGHYLGGEAEFLIVPDDSKNIYKVEVVTLSICKDTMTRVLRGNTRVIEHSLTSRWEDLVISYTAHKVFNVNSLVVLLYDQEGRKAYYTVDKRNGVTKMCNRRTVPIETYIRLTLENQIASNVIILSNGTIQRKDLL
jgi:hypothetical protein